MNRYVAAIHRGACIMRKGWEEGRKRGVDCQTGINIAVPFSLGATPRPRHPIFPAMSNVPCVSDWRTRALLPGDERHLSGAGRSRKFRDIRVNAKPDQHATLVRLRVRRRQEQGTALLAIDTPCHQRLLWASHSADTSTIHTCTAALATVTYRGTVVLTFQAEATHASMGDIYLP